jgi:hypothetical protein
VLEALDCPNADANAILSELGAPPVRTNFPADRFPHYFFSVAELQDAVEQASWPEFVINDNIEVVAANTAAQALWQANFAHEKRKRTGPQMNLLAVANDYRFTERVLNWEECVAVIAGVLKGRPTDAHTLDEPDPYFSLVLEEFAKGDPAFLSRMIEILAKTPARDPKVRWSYPVSWRDDDFGDMRFMAVVGTASEPDGLSFNDWIPLDAESWQVLERVKARGIPNTSPDAPKRRGA